MLTATRRSIVPPPQQLIDGYSHDRIRFRASRLGQAFRLNEDEIEDIEQDFAIEVVRAARRFDPSRSSWRTFLSRVLDRRYAHIARQLRSNRRRQNRDFEPSTSFGMSMCRGEHEWQVDLQADVTQILTMLNPRLQKVAATLMLCTPNETAAHLGLHRSTIYRDIAKLREVFVMQGFDDFPHRRATRRRKKQM